MKYDFIFCVISYGNITDLKKIFLNKFNCSYKVIVVDCFYSDAVCYEMRSIAEFNNAEFISVPNKGYGTAINAGIHYASEHYSFRYLAIMNSDILIESFDVNDISDMEGDIFGPYIVTAKGKKQNPYRPYYLGNTIETLTYYGFKCNSKLCLYAGYAVNKLLREAFSLWYEIFGGRGRTYSLHGCFFIFGKDALKVLMEDAPIFDHNMFMFNEEMELARKARKHGIKLYYVPKLKIRHFEDGSINMAKKFDEHSEERKSYLYCYEKWSSHN